MRVPPLHTRTPPWRCRRGGRRGRSCALRLIRGSAMAELQPEPEPCGHESSGPFAFLRGEGAAGADEQLETLACNYLALGQWELGRAALCQLATRGAGGTVSAAAILEAVARRVPPTWLPPASNASPNATMLGQHHLRWWCAAQSGELRAASVPPALRAHVELVVCAAELDPTLAEELTSASAGTEELTISVDDDRAQSWLGKLRGWLLHGDTPTVGRAVTLCELLHRSLPADQPSRDAVGELPFEVAAQWLAEAENGTRSRPAQQWGHLGLVWHRAGGEHLAQLSEQAMRRRATDPGPRAAMNAHQSRESDLRAAEGHARIVASLLGSDSTQPLRQYCTLAEQAGLAAPLPGTDGVPNHFRSYSLRVNRARSRGSIDGTSGAGAASDEAQAEAQLVAASRLEFWHDHTLYCKRHGLHGYGSVLRDGIRFIVAGADDQLAELLAPMPTVVHAALLILCWPTLCIWSDESKRAYSVLAAEISQVSAATTEADSDSKQTHTTQTMSPWIECAQCLCHYAVSAIWYADVYEKLTGSVLEAIISSSRDTERDSTADLDGSIFCTLKHLDARQCTVMDLVLPVLDTDEWIGALCMLGKGGKHIDRSKELQLKAFICCYRLIRRPLSTQTQSDWLISQLCSIQLDFHDARATADACATCRHLLRASVDLQDWEHEAGGSRSPEYAQWVLRGILTFVQEQMAAAAAAADCDKAETTGAVLENIRGVQQAVSEAENRMAVLALLGSRIDIADSFSYVCWLLASPEQLLCVCLKLGDFACCEQIVQMFKMSTRHRNIVVAARCHQEWSLPSASQLKQLHDPVQMKDAIAHEVELTASVSSSASGGSAGDPSSCDGLQELTIGLVFALFDLSVCSEISCEASSHLLSVCRDYLRQFLDNGGTDQDGQTSWKSQSAPDHPCLATVEAVTTELLAASTALSKLPRFCKNLRSLISDPSRAGWSLSDAGLGQEQQARLAQGIALRQNFSNQLELLAQAAADRSAIVRENTHREWCIDAASQLTRLLARGAWVQASYPFLPTAHDVEDRAINSTQSETTGLGRPYLLAFFKEYLCKVQAALVQSVDAAETSADALSPASYSLASIIESEHGNPLEIVETILVTSAPVSRSDGINADAGAKSASSFGDNVRRATPVADAFGLSIGGVLLESASGPWADREPEGLARAHSSFENLARLSSAGSSVSTASGARDSIGSLSSLLSPATDFNGDHELTMQALRKLYEVSPILAVVTASQMATVDARPCFGEMAINSSAQLPSLRRWLVRRWMPRRMLHELTSSTTPSSASSAAVVAAGVETNGSSIVLSRDGGLDDCNRDLSTARTIIAAMQGCGDIASACSCADDLLEGGAPDTLLLALATYYDDTAADSEQRREVVERIRSPVDAAQMCLQWLPHWSTAECIPLLQHCLDQLQSSLEHQSTAESESSDGSGGISTQEQSEIDRQKITRCIAELTARKTELSTYESVLATTDELGPWQQLDRMCRNDIGAAVSRLVQLELYPHAHQVLAQYEHRAAAELSTAEAEQPYSGDGAAAAAATDRQARLQRLHATVDRKELLSFVLSNRSGMHEALPLLSRCSPLDALRLCNSVISFVAGPEGSVHAEIQIVQIMLLLARGLPHSLSDSLAAQALPTVAELEMRALGLRALALLPDRWKAEARPLSASPTLIIESLLRCREIALVAELLAAFPTLVDSEMLMRYALAALLPPRTINTLVNTTVIASYFEDSNLALESPRAAPLQSGHRSDCPWLTGDPSDDEMLRSCFEISGPPSVLLAKRYLRLHGTDRYATIGKAALSVSHKLLLLQHASSTDSTARNDAVGGKSAAALESCRHAARQLAVYASEQLAKSRDVTSVHTSDEIDIETELKDSERMVSDIDLLTELAAVAGITASLADLRSSVQLARLCDELMESDCIGLAVRLAEREREQPSHLGHNLLAEKYRWRWGIEALACGHYSAAREHLTPLILLLSEAAAPRSSSVDVDGAAERQRDTAVEEILQHLLVQPLSLHGRLREDTSSSRSSARSTDATGGDSKPGALSLGGDEGEHIWTLDSAGDAKLILRLPAAVLMSKDRLWEAFYYLGLTHGSNGDATTDAATLSQTRHGSRCHAVTLNFLMHLRQLTPAVQYCALREVPSHVFVETVLAGALQNKQADQLEQLASLLQQLKQPRATSSPTPGASCAPSSPADNPMADLDRLSAHPQQYDGLIRDYLQASCDFLLEHREYSSLLTFATVAEDHKLKAQAHVSLFCGLDRDLSSDGDRTRTEAATAQAERAEELLVAAEECCDLGLEQLRDTERETEREAEREADAEPEVELRRKQLYSLKQAVVLQRALVGLTKPSSPSIPFDATGLRLRDVTILNADGRRVEMVAVQLAMSGRWAVARRIPLTLGAQLQLDGGAIALRALGLLTAAIPAQNVELELLMDQLQEEQELHTKAKEHNPEGRATETIEIPQGGWNAAIIDLLRRKQVPFLPPTLSLTHTHTYSTRSHLPTQS